MEVHFSPDVETRLRQVALANGKDAEQLVKDTVAARSKIRTTSSQECKEASSKPTAASLLSTKTSLTDGSDTKQVVLRAGQLFACA
jgi:hypothetical protein